MIKTKLSSDRLRRFKTEVTDENRLIAAAVRRLMPPSQGGLILDVGAGLGDIAASAFPDRSAVLIDILDFGSSCAPAHRRETIDFFDFRTAPGEAIDVMLLSHVTQYIDDDLALLSEAIRDLSPTHLIVVANDATPMHDAIERWFSEVGLVHNAEQIFDVCPLPEFVRVDKEALTSHLRCTTFPELARQLTSMIYDADLTREQVNDFAKWLRDRIETPELKIPQTATLYRKDVHLEG